MGVSGPGWNRSVSQAGRQRGLRDIDQQLGHFGLARQLAQQLAQHVLHLVQLLLQRLEIDRLGLLGRELLLELLFLAGQRLQRILLVADVEVPAEQARRRQTAGR